ncbi:hypothetical protein VB773_14430 [Haloarculaceae archaeon H-GB2-1]|nr:hypothetical protein [Haloarculaceae archaeon H-GB2-1]
MHGNTGARPGGTRGEEIYAGVSLGDEDALCLTPTRTLVYRGEGLLSDESVDAYPHTVERLRSSEGRRKTKFVFEYVDGEQSLKVPSSRAEPVLEHLIEAILRTDGVIGEEESVAGAYRFSELTLIVTDERVIKRIGSAIWGGDDFEVYPYEDLTGLGFEPGSVATQVVIEVDGRPQRIKAPNDDAPLLKRTLQEAVFEYFDVHSMAELDEVVGADDADEPSRSADDASDIEFGSGIDPLVSSGVDEQQAPVDEPQAEQRRDESRPERDRPPRDEPATTDADPEQEPATSASDPLSESRDRNQRQTESEQRADAGRSSQRRTESSHGSSEEVARERDPDQESRTAAGTAEEERRASIPDAEQSERDSRRSAERTSDASANAGRGKRSDRNHRANSERSTESAQQTTDRRGSGTDNEPSIAEVAGLVDEEEAEDSASEIEALAAQVEELTAAVDRQNELLKKQHRAIKFLLEERGEQ